MIYQERETENKLKKQFEKMQTSLNDRLYLITCKCYDRKTVSSIEMS